MPHPFFALDTPIAIGHRGAAGEQPENTLASFARALADGAEILESDVHLTRDGVPVLIHDDRVDRNTEASGRVAEFDFAALARLDAGYRFSPQADGATPERGRGHRIPSLAQALEAMPGARFNLELKEDRPGIVEETLRAIDEAGRASHTLVTAADDPLMAKLREAVARLGVPVALGACTGDVAAFARSAVAGEAPPAGAMALQIPTQFAGRPLVTPELVAHAHRHGVQVHVWTVNDADEMAALLDLGVDGLISDYPARVVALRKARR